MKILISERQYKFLKENKESIWDKLLFTLKTDGGYSDKLINISIKNIKDDLNKLGSKKSKYEKWVLTWTIEYFKKRGNTEIIYDLIDLVKEFDLVQNRFTYDVIVSLIDKIKDGSKILEKIKNAPKDINNYSPELLSKILDNLPESKTQEKKKISKEVEKVYEDENLLVIRPITKEASCKYGANTKWCTAGRLDNRFASHFDDGLLIYYIFKPNVKLPSERYRKLASFQSIDNNYEYDWFDSKDKYLPFFEFDTLKVDFKVKKSFDISLDVLEKKYELKLKHHSDDVILY